MPNDFYTPTGNPADNSNIVSADMRAEFAAINAGFNKLPTLTGNANKLVVINSSGTGMDATIAPAGLTSINKVAITQPATGATLTILDGKTLTVNNTLTLAGTDGTVMTFPATSATIARTDAANTFVGVQDFDGRIDANAGLAVTGANFTSRGITDSATATALTLSGSGANHVTIANGGSPTIRTSGGPLQLSSGASAGAESYIYSLCNLEGSTPALVSTAGFLIGANKSSGNGDVAFFNPYYIAAISFDFRQITAFGVSASVARMLPISGGTAGLVFVQGSGTVNARIGTDAASNIIIGSGTALSTSATTNHMMIPTCAGTPTGVPVDAAPGRLPLIYDTTNNKLYAYNGAWKSTAALT